MKFCKYTDWNTQQTRTIYNGHWGDWGDWVYCDKDKYIRGAQIRFERAHAGDNTALNVLKIKCDDTWKLVANGNWGTWRDKVFNDDMLVDGGQIRYDPDQGDVWGDTAMNGLKLH